MIRINKFHQNYIQSKREAKGFTFIELMIVMVIIGIIAAIGYPSYLNHLQKSRRVDAQTALLELAQYMERYYTTNGTYVGAVLPFTASPKDDVTKYYNLSVSGVAANAYSLSGAPTGSQTTDACGTLTLSQTGAKTPTTSGCWN